MANNRAIGIDLGGTKIKAALIDPDGNVLHELKERTQKHGEPRDVIDQLARIVRQLLEYTDRDPAIPIGLGVAGQIDARTGALVFAPNLNGWRDFPVKQLLQDALEQPINISNDVRAAGFGEWRHGAGQGCHDIIVLFVGTGIGGCVISGGHILTGHANTAGELGHTTIVLGGPKCHCNNYGCLEAVAGGWAIARRAGELVAEDPVAGATLLERVDGNADLITAKTVSRAAQNGDPLASQIIAEAIAALIGGCVTFVNAFGPRRIIFGGGVIEGYPELIPAVAEGVRRRALPSAVADIEMVKARLGGNAGVIGAARMAREATQEGA